MHPWFRKLLINGIVRQVALNVKPQLDLRGIKATSIPSLVASRTLHHLSSGVVYLLTRWDWAKHYK
jgi:hypothetical protein